MDEVLAQVRRSLGEIVRVVGVVAVIGTAPIACREARGTSASIDTSYRVRPGYVVDSVRPIEVELARFRAGLGAAPTTLAGPMSFDALLSAFASAVTARDSSVLKALLITPAEFAYLIYPSSPYTRPPYRETPQNLWYQVRSGGAAGLTRLVARRGGHSLRIVSHQCDAPTHEELNTLWRHCVVTTVGPDGRRVEGERLFGVVIERAGRFKFVSYQNQY